MGSLADSARAAVATAAVVGNTLAGPATQALDVEPDVARPVAGLVEAAAQMAKSEAEARALRDSIVGEAPPDDGDYADHADPPDGYDAEQVDAYEVREAQPDAYEAQVDTAGASRGGFEGGAW